MTDQRVSVVSYEFMGDFYSGVRMRVPYRPAVLDGGMDCKRADDVFELYLRYVRSLQRMGYTTTTVRKLKKYASVEEKILAEVRFHKATIVLCGKDAPDWFKNIDFGADIELVEMEISKVKYQPPDLSSMLEIHAWQRVWAWLTAVKMWTRTDLEIWTEPGKDVVGSRHLRSRRGAGRGRDATQELEELTQAQIDAIKAGQDPAAVLGDRVLKKNERQLVANAREEAILAAAKHGRQSGGVK